MKLRNMDEVHAFAYALAEEIRRLGWEPKVENGLSRLAVGIPGCEIHRYEVKEQFAPDPYDDRDPADVADAMGWQAYTQTFAQAVEQKSIRLRRVMVNWIPMMLADKVPQAVREATERVLQAYPRIAPANDPDDDDDEDRRQEYIDDVVETVAYHIEQAIGAVEVQLNHAFLGLDDAFDARDFVYAEVKHEATKRLICELAHQLENAAKDAILPPSKK